MTQNYVNDVLIKLFESVTIKDKEGNDVSIFIIDNGKYIDINYEFEEFTRPSTGVWYALHFLPSQPEQIELGHNAMNEWSGIFQIDVCVIKSIKTIGLSGEGPGVKDYFDTAYAAIAEVMKRGVIQNRVHITGIGRSSAVDNGDYYTLPISVRWYANLSN